jgi:histone H3/H4
MAEETTMATTATSGKKKKGAINKYGYTTMALKRQARRAGTPRIHKLAPEVSERMLDVNMRRIMRVAATRAIIAKHHTIQLEYVIDATKLATGLTLLGFGGIKDQRAASKRSKKGKAAGSQ